MPKSSTNPCPAPVFRRSHTIAYAPACPGCSACVPVRIVVDGFKPNKTQRRIIRRNADFTVSAVANRATAEQYALFSRYQDARHTSSDMAMMSLADYRSMVEDSPIETYMIEFRAADADQTLVAAVLVDELSDGLSAVYSFFEPELSDRSLGTYMVLWLVEEAVTARLALRLSRLLDRREPQDGLQAAVSAARRLRSGGLDPAGFGRLAPRPPIFVRAARSPFIAPKTRTDTPLSLKEICLFAEEEQGRSLRK